MSRPRKPDSLRLQNAPVKILPETREDAQRLALETDLTEAEILREAIVAGLPHVPRLLERRRKQERDAQRKAPRSEAVQGSNVVPIKSAADGVAVESKPSSRIERPTYGLRNSWLTAQITEIFEIDAYRETAERTDLAHVA